MKIIKAQSLKLVCHVFSEEDVSKRIYWYFNYHQPLQHNNLYNESTILIDTPQNHDTVCKNLEKTEIQKEIECFFTNSIHIYMYISFHRALEGSICLREFLLIIESA